MALFLKNKDGMLYRVAGAPTTGISEVPIATETIIGGIKSSQQNGEVNVDEAGISKPNNIVTIPGTGNFQVPNEWGEGPWVLECTEDHSLDEYNGLPIGGLAGQVLAKTGTTDYQCGWQTLTANNIIYQGTTKVKDIIDEQGEDIIANTADIADNTTKITNNTNKINVINSSLTYYTNKNFLYNWYFGNLINQRAQTSYNTNDYCIDGWRLDIATGGATLTVEDGYIRGTKLSNGSDKRPYQSLSQVIEYPKRFSGKTVTFSVLTKGPGLGQLLYYVNTGVFALHGNLINSSTGWNLHSFTTTLPENVTYLCVYSYFDTKSATTTGYTDYLAAKLELGAQSTLAHQDSSGNWILNEIPDYADQLAICQRYQLAVRLNTMIRMSRYRANTIDFWLPTPVSLRTTPTIIDSSVFQVQNLGGNTVTDFTFSVPISAYNGVLLRATKTAHGLTDGVCVTTGMGLLNANL